MQVFEGRLPYAIVGISLSTDGRFVLVSDDTVTPEVWDRGTGKKVYSSWEREYGRGELHPSGEFYLLKRGFSLLVVDLSTRRSQRVGEEWKSDEFRFVGASILVAWGMGSGRQYSFTGYVVSPDREVSVAWEVPAERGPYTMRSLQIDPSGSCFAYQFQPGGFLAPRGGEVHVRTVSDGRQVERIPLSSQQELKGILDPNTILVADRDR
jgi:hypothetical protein